MPALDESEVLPSGSDVLDAPLEPGLDALDRWDRRGRRTGPVAADTARGRLLFILAPGTADEVPGLLDWLGWGGIALDLGGRRLRSPARTVWVRPPAAGLEPPGLELGSDQTLPRLLDTVAGSCARALLRRPALTAAAARSAPAARTVRELIPDQLCAFSYASRTLPGTRPRSFTS